MATGMKKWIGLTVAGIALVALWLLPPDAMQPRTREFRLPEITRFERLQNEINRADRVLQRIRWADSLGAYTVANAEDGFTVGYPTGITRDERDQHFDETGEAIHALIVEFTEEAKERFTEQIRTEVQALDRHEDVLFGYYFVNTRSSSSIPDGSGTSGRTSETFVGEVDGQAYCARVALSEWFNNRYLDEATQVWVPSGEMASGSTLSYCRPFVRFGLPGPHIHQWLKDGALNFAAVGTPGFDREGPEYLWMRSRRSYFGLAGFSIIGQRNQDVAVDQCLAGIPEGCLTMLTTPEILRRSEGARHLVENSPSMGAGDSNWQTPLGAYDDYILLDLEEEFGGDAFADFWTSDKPVIQAFEDSFGVGMGEWVVRWVETNLSVSRPGPRLTRTAALGGMLTVTLLAALTGAYVRRRRVG